MTDLIPLGPGAWSFIGLYLVSLIAIGWQRVRVTHRGQIIAGSTSTRWRSISNDALPEPMITAARSSVTGTVPPARIRPTSWRLSSMRFSTRWIVQP